jgi:hypothetical protein
MNMTIFKLCMTIFNKLQGLGLDVETGNIQYEKAESEGFMPLSVDYLGHRGGEEGCFDIALAHRFEQNGDLMADPDMEIRIHPKIKVAEALTFQQDSIALYQEVYPEPGKYFPRLQKDLNVFLNMWLRNIEQQGFRFTQIPNKE